MNLRKGFLAMAISLSGLLLLIGGITWAALNAFNQTTELERHRQSSLALIGEIRHELDLLGRLVNSYVSTADPRFLHYYYDILAIREGAKVRPDSLPPAFWDEVIAGTKTYALPPGSRALSLVERTKKLEFNPQEQAIVSRILALTEQTKQIEQVAFAATQGLYDPEKDDFVSETTPQRQFANQLLHRTDYLKLRADLAIAAEALSSLVDARTQSSLANAGRLLKNWIIAALGMLTVTVLWLIFGYHYLRRNLLKPLIALHRTATALAGKSYEQRVGRIRGLDEVKTLASTIDGMATAIEADIGQREITQRALSEARARAEVATEAKSIFLANMSHEIRTPMNAILGMAYLALKSGLPPRQHDQINKIHGAAKTLLGILNDILDFSKIEAGKINLENAPFELEEVVRNALSMVQQAVGEKQLELILDYRVPHSPARFIGDPLRLGQVLVNLLSNAVKFTETGHVRLCIEEAAEDSGAANIRFAIEDTGIGMTPEQVKRLFQEFSQADGSTTRKYGGTGLGLSISKRLIEAMGSEILVNSEVNRGSCFTFTIALPFSRPESGNTPKLPLNAPRALVVDDYQPSRDSLAALLSQLGCATVDTAEGGAAGLAHLRQAAQSGQTYDLLLLDWQMPGISGADVLKILRTEHIPLPLRSIVISALDASLLRDETASLGIAETLQKPLLPEMLDCIAPLPHALSLPPSPPEAGAKPLAGMRILVVDDDQINRQISHELLHDWGAVVVLNTDGASAVATVFSHPPDYFNVVLMDLEMPIMNGNEATQCLRADPRFGQLPILAMTAYAVGRDLNQALREGMNGHIPKPLDPDKLLSTLISYNSRQRTSAPRASTSTEQEIALPPSILALSGLDTSALNHRFHGRAPFLIRMLQRFAFDFGNFSNTLQSLLTSGNSNAAMRQAHSLKGLAGTFGMTQLQGLSLAAENSLRNEGKLSESLEKALGEALQQVLEAINQIEVPSSGIASTEFDPEETQVLLRRLRHYLAEADGEAEGLWTNHKAQFASLYPPSTMARIERAISYWNFDDALAALSRSTPENEEKS